MKRLFPYLAIFLLIFLITGCGKDKAEKNGGITYERIQKSDITDFIDPDTLYSAGLEKVWENDLAIAKKEYLQTIDIVGEHLYCLTNENYLFSLNRTSGDIIFGEELTHRNLPVLGFREYDSAVFSVAGNRLVVLSAQTGEVRDSFAEDYTISCMPAQNGSYFYVGTSDGILRALRIKDKVGIHEVTGGQVSEIITVVYNSYGVIFATRAGNIVCANPVVLSKNWGFSIEAGLGIPVRIEGDSVYAVGNDAKLYRISLENGELVWKRTVGMPEDGKPVVGEKNVYQMVEDKKLVALDKTSGEILWETANAETALNEIDGKSYIACEDGLKVFDAVTGELERELKLGIDCVYGVNTKNELIYLSDRSGNICCVKPIK